MEKLERFIGKITEEVVSACNRRVDPYGSMLNIGEHVTDVKLKAEFDPGKVDPEKAVFVFEKDGGLYYAVPDRDFIRKANEALKKNEVDEAGWFGRGEKFNLDMLTKDAESLLGKIQYKAEVICEERGGSAGNAAIAEATFIRFLQHIIQRSGIDGNRKLKADFRLGKMKIIYLSIDPEENGSRDYYEEHGVEMVCIHPKGYDRVPANLIFELGNKRTILRSPLSDYNLNDGSFYIPDIIKGLHNIAHVNVVAPKNPYLMELGMALFNSGNVARAGLFTRSSLTSEEDTVRNGLVSETELLVENREENAEITRAGDYGGIENMAGLKNIHWYIITRDKRGVVGADYRHGKKVRSVQAYDGNIGNNPQFTGAGDVGDGVINVCYSLGLSLETALSLANLFAEYRINRGGIHAYAEEIDRDRKKSRGRLTVEDLVYCEAVGIKN